MTMRADGSGAMFDRIAPRYDLLNRLMSLGLDRAWRRRLVAAMPERGPLLDVATGTADVALALAAARPGTHVTGLDPSAGMLAAGRRKAAARGLDARIHLVEGDALGLPFADDTFAGTSIAFGIRNVPDRARALREMARVTRPGGPVVLLELSEPDFAPARFHVHHVIPRLGALISGAPEYRYLQASVAAFPSAPAFASMMVEAGLRDVETHRFAFGVAHLYVGVSN